MGAKASRAGVVDGLVENIVAGFEEAEVRWHVVSIFVEIMVVDCLLASDLDWCDDWADRRCEGMKDGQKSIWSFDERPGLTFQARFIRQKSVTWDYYDV